MEFLKCRDVRWKGPEKRNKPDVVATTAKHPDSRSQISRYGWIQPTYMRSVSFWGKFTSGSRIRASRSDLLKLPNAMYSTWKCYDNPDSTLWVEFVKELEKKTLNYILPLGQVALKFCLSWASLSLLF